MKPTNIHSKSTENYYEMEKCHSERNACVRFEVFTAVTLKNGVFWDVTPCGSYKNPRFGGT
jgi:hypothetical protein